LQVTVRLPGKEPYSYVEIVTANDSPQACSRELRDVDDNLLTLAAKVLNDGQLALNLAPLNPRPIEDPSQGAMPEPAWNDAPSMPDWAQAPQEAQGYSQPQYQPQAQPQGFQQQFQPQQGYQQPAQQSMGNPPGQQAPFCSQHGQPAKLVPGGISRNTKQPYSAFWACSAGDNNCTKASRFPKAQA
jgi:hypothetical protein